MTATEHASESQTATDGPSNRSPTVVRAAGTDLASHLRLWIFAVGGLALDLWSKDWAFHHLNMQEGRTIWPGVFSIRLSLNPGALFGIGAGWAPLFIGASVMALIFVVYLFWQCTASRRSLHIALGCVLAGAVGNLYDRSMHQAYVVELKNGSRDICELVIDSPNGKTVADFATRKNPRLHPKRTIEHAEMQPVVRDFLSIDSTITLSGKTYRLWPWVFNVADVLLVCGVMVLMLNIWIDHREQRALPTTPSPVTKSS